MQLEGINDKVEKLLEQNVSRKDILALLEKQGYITGDILDAMNAVDAQNASTIKVVQPTTSVPQQASVPSQSIAVNTTSTDGFSISKLLGTGWHLTWKHIWFILLLWILYIGYYVIIQVVFSSFAANLTEINYLIYIFFSAVFYLLSIYFYVGIMSISLKYLKGENASLFDLFPPLSLFFRFIIMSFIQVAILLGGFIMLIVPGIYWSEELSLSGFYLIDKKTTPLTSLKASVLLTHKLKWRIALFWLAALGVIILGFIALIIGIFIAEPIILFGFTAMYFTLDQQTNPTAALAKVKFFTIPKIIAMILGSICICGFIFLSFFPQIEYMFYTSLLLPRKVYPLVYTIPPTLSIQSMKIANVPSYSFKTLIFQFPWDEQGINQQLPAGQTNAKILQFSSGKKVDILYTRDQDLMQSFTANNTNSLFAIPQSQLKTEMQTLYGENGEITEFTMEKNALLTSPANITLMTSPKDAIYDATNSIMKNVFILDTTTDNFYIFSTNEFDGFVYPQKNNISNRNYIIEVWDHNQNHYTFIITDPTMTDSDVRQFIGSLAIGSASDATPVAVPTPTTKPLLIPSQPLTTNTLPTINISKPMTLTVENNILLTLTSLSSDTTGMHATAIFTNNSSTAQTIDPTLQLQSGNLREPANVPGNENAYYPAESLAARSTKSYALSFDRMAFPVTIFYISSIGSSVTVGTYNGN